jgi:AcrR family transcriptional regulator
MTPQVAERRTAEERREQIVQAAIRVFADHGYDAASTDEIARLVGISQPYLFRLFSTKRELVLASIDRCFRDTETLFTSAARGLSGLEAMHAIGDAYLDMIRRDPIRLRAQLQAYAACEDPEIRRLVATNFGALVGLVQRLSGASTLELSKFFAEGMLLNVLAIMRQFEDPQPWAAQLIEGCMEDSQRTSKE